MELWVVTALLSLSLPLMSLLRLARAGEQKCFVYEEKLSRLIGLPYLLRRDSLLCRIVSSPPSPPPLLSTKHSEKGVKRREILGIMLINTASHQQLVLKFL